MKSLLGGGRSRGTSGAGRLGSELGGMRDRRRTSTSRSHSIALSERETASHGQAGHSWNDATREPETAMAMPAAVTIVLQTGLPAIALPMTVSRTLTVAPSPSDEPRTLLPR